jgi:hypothetical protein
MKPKDKHYLTLQFQNKIYQKNSTEFQSFFESIMKKAYEDFEVVRPYGNLGDGGNDGFRRTKGIYYQVNSPIKPDEKEVDAAKKLSDDFYKLLDNWDKIEKVKEYIFVYNDKYMGTVLPFELAIADLKKSNPKTEFKILFANKLERIFFELTDSDMKVLGFDIDKLKSNEIISTALENIKKELDCGNNQLAKSNLKNCKSLISGFSGDIQLEYELVYCAYLRSAENYKKAIKKYKKLCKKYPEDCRPYVSLTNIYIRQNKVKKSLSMLQKAKNTDKNNPIVVLEELNINYILNKKVDLNTLDQLQPNISDRLKAQFYLLNSLIFEREQDNDKSDQYLKKSLALNSNRVVSYIIKFEILENRMVLIEDHILRRSKAKKLLSEIQKIQNKFQTQNDINIRNLISFTSKKLNSNLILDNSIKYEKGIKFIFENIKKCYFDAYVDSILSQCLPRVKIPIKEFNELLGYIKKSKFSISDRLSKALLIQFTVHDSLFTDGVIFFGNGKNKLINRFIKDLQEKNMSGITRFLDNDTQFAIEFMFSLKSPIGLRKSIYNELPTNLEHFKDKLLIQLYYDEGELDNAFEIIKNVDLQIFHFTECESILEIVQSKNAWELEVKLINKIIEGDNITDSDYKLNLIMQLINANFNFKNHKQVIKIGKSLLTDKQLFDRLTDLNKEILLANVVMSYLERGKVNSQNLINAKRILEIYAPISPTFEFKIDIEAEVYFRNNNIRQAFDSIVEGVKIKKILSAQEYAKMHLICTVKIPQKTVKDLNSQQSISDNSFVKLSTYDEWHCLGVENELDAIKVTNCDSKYKLLIDKKVGDQIIIENKYGSNDNKLTIEKIFPIEKYIIWKALESFNKLAPKGDVPGITVVETPRTGKEIDINNLLQFFEDERSQSQPFYDLYIKNNVPLSMLAINEGGLHKALSKILKEGKGFINSSSGNIDEFKNELALVRDILDNETPFYIDGTSAFFMSEKGLFKDFFKSVKFLKVPSSVIRFLVELSAEIGPQKGSEGYIGYAEGQIQLLPPERKLRNRVKKNLLKTVKLLEKRPDNIIEISPAFKEKVFFESKIHDELSDACILSQKEETPILTEDFIHLYMNAAETKKTAPKHFSSYALVSVLYEKDLIDYETYLNYFSYLAHYRFRCLLITPESIERAILGDSKTKYYKLENIKKLNLPLILSEEYGVHFRTSFNLIILFMLNIFKNDEVSNVATKEIFNEIVANFPAKVSSSDIGQLLLNVSQEVFSLNEKALSELPNFEKIKEKITFLISPQN